MVTKIMFSIGRNFEINLQMLKKWVETVRKDLSERCVSDTRSLGNVTQGINYVQEKLVRVIWQSRNEKNVMNN